MKVRHAYRITLEALPEAPGQAAPHAPVTLPLTCHDDLFAIVDSAQTRGDLPPADAAVFALGLKLFSEVMLRHRNAPLFRAFHPQFAAFMKTLKSGAAPAA
ncbi:MAG: DUF3861 domain-containing protein [Rhodocyclaceae bacterium]|nr:DUF3861 domain-containing protein [Rhodocyclaceae bacterium]